MWQRIWEQPNTRAHDPSLRKRKEGWCVPWSGRSAPRRDARARQLRLFNVRSFEKQVPTTGTPERTRHLQAGLAHDGIYRSLVCLGFVVSRHDLPEPSRLLHADMGALDIGQATAPPR